MLHSPTLRSLGVYANMTAFKAEYSNMVQRVVGRCNHHRSSD